KEAQIKKMDEVYEKSLATVNTMTKLLEYNTAETKSLTASVTQIVEREQRREERAAERRKQLEEQRKQKEENKTVWQKLFG
ncbi:MAG: hypothetical protein GY774_38365, partial [Planctomycetes bacterium]|nr:hypothetical protein [Planctomycetota bacterium]